ncbi:hypothetical protein [Actinophytocola sp.]|uniref:hypothetical protein n=1 Tax=Actinophytocola sp. TaxID=1872138 RepID=UPI003D6A4889
MGLFSRKCPVGEKAGHWTEESMRWFREQFGDDPLGSDPVLPTAELFPSELTGEEADVRELLDRLCAHLAVDPKWVTLEITPFGESGLVRQASYIWPVEPGYRPLAPDRHDRWENGRRVIEIHPDISTRPTDLMARLTRDLCHTRLLAEERITTKRRDHQQLADLLAVYFGLGIFAANASFDHHAGRYGGMRRVGHLPEPMFGYGLACYAWLRGESWPDWTEYLDHGPQSSMNHGLRYLARVAEPGELPAGLHPVDDSPD